MSRLFRTLNIEQNMPTVVQAEAQLRFEIQTCRRLGVRVLKIIHGYGSTGTGGALRIGLRAYLKALLRDGAVKGYIEGENWSIFNASARKVIDTLPELRQDKDLNRSNNGITVIML